MPSGTFGISTGAVAQSAAEVNAAGNELEGVLAQLDAWVRETSAAWEGQASDAYVVAQDNWTQAARELRDLMTTVGTTLDHIAEQAAAVEAANTNMWS